MIKTVSLNNGAEMPILGLGTWASPPNQVKAAVSFAIMEAGYRHIDAAKAYGNEAEIGSALNQVFSETSIKRSELFITSKLWNTDHHPDTVITACKQTLADLQVEYVDLYLMHWGLAFAPDVDAEPKDRFGRMKIEPVSIQQTWQAMEKLVDQGLVKAIGVSNFTAPMLLDLLSYARIKPAMNQVELHPYHSQNELVHFCQDRSIQVTAYSPLGSPNGPGKDRPKLIADPVITQLATAYSKTPAQIILKWATQRGTVVIPKSVTLERIRENIGIFDFTLEEKDIAQINKLDTHQRYLNPVDVWGIPYFD